MKRKIIISYEWWDACELKEIPEEVIELLEKHAEKRINLQIKKGFTSGDLFANIYVEDEYDEEEGDDYAGVWNLERLEQNYSESKKKITPFDYNNRNKK